VAAGASLAGTTLVPAPLRAPAAPCEPIGVVDAIISVTPPADTHVVGLKLQLDYPVGVVDLPGDADEASVKARVRPLPGGLMFSPNDTDGSMIVALVGTTPLAVGPLLEVQFDRCKGEAVPTAKDFHCGSNRDPTTKGGLLSKESAVPSRCRRRGNEQMIKIGIFGAGGAARVRVVGGCRGRSQQGGRAVPKGDRRQDEQGRGDRAQGGRLVSCAARQGQVSAATATTLATADPKGAYAKALAAATKSIDKKCLLGNVILGNYEGGDADGVLFPIIANARRGAERRRASGRRRSSATRPR
jgi:hypothetical protein